ncbi:vanadium-dependent haloperoxidase [Hydrogenophaga sp. MI9]|uniref:vanadium-dependent haloperoxidase n=1 Tax=Hydrogenophaga sp. MI9 TaxID=3453719 RepID=UPI003EEA35A6
MTFPLPNADESLVTTDGLFMGSFHKTLPHNEFGEVEAAAYRKFERTCMAVEAGAPGNFEEVPSGPLTAPFPAQSEKLVQTQVQSAFANCVDKLMVRSAAKFTSPMAGASTETHGLDPKAQNMPPAPSCLSVSAAAEMVELYWMALLRDAPLLAFQSDPTQPAKAPQSGCQAASLSDHDSELGYQLDKRVRTACKAVNDVFDCAVRLDTDPGRLRAPLDLQEGMGGAAIDVQTLFRSGLMGENLGPLVSQFFLRPIRYGAQTIDQRIVPYQARRDFLTMHSDWLLAQNTGLDKYGRDYGNCNHYADQLRCADSPYYPTDNGEPDGRVITRYISTVRDLARFVNRDALHQAYFNAALFLDGLNGALPASHSILDAGNPYRGKRYSREGGFATLGGPDLLTLVSEVASRALKVVWRQKWLVHRRGRPEAYGGLLQMQHNGYGGCLRDYGLPHVVHGAPQFGKALKTTWAEVMAHNKLLNGGEATLFLPMAFSAGSPSHPAYGAGHATVAGACVTVLKAWFDEDAKLADLFGLASEDLKDPPMDQWMLLQPGYRSKGGGLEAFCEPAEYQGKDAGQMTIGGELNKIASNVAMGRSMGGVHWRSDNTRSLRLGEQVAIEILRKRTLEYAERPVSFTFRSFDRQVVRISQGQVQIE